MPDYRVNVFFLDENEGSTSKSIEGTFADTATATTAANNLITDITALTSAAIEKWELTQVFQVNGTPAAGSNVFSRVSATLKLNNGGNANHKFPSPVSDVLAGNSLIFNQDPANAWDDYIANFTATNAGWTLSDGEYVQDTDPTSRGKRVYVRSGSTNLP